jgi:hypothetical protein
MKQKYEKPATKDLSHVLTVMGASPQSCVDGSSATGEPVDPGRPKYCVSGKTASGKRCADGQNPQPSACASGKSPEIGGACSVGIGV